MHTRPICFGEVGQEWKGPGSHNRTDVGVLIDFDGQVAEALFFSQIPGKPITLSGNMIENQVKHQLEVTLHGNHIVPGAQFRVDRVEIDHRETIIG